MKKFFAWVAFKGNWNDLSKEFIPHDEIKNAEVYIADEVDAEISKLKARIEKLQDFGKRAIEALEDKGE